MTKVTAKSSTQFHNYPLIGEYYSQIRLALSFYTSLYQSIFLTLKQTHDMAQPMKGTITTETKVPRKHFLRKLTHPFIPSDDAKVAPKLFKPTVIELSKFEKVVLDEVKENIGVISSMGDGSLPFLIGLLASKFKLVFTNEEGFIRSRFLKATILHLQELNLLRVQHTSKFPLGPGRVALV